MSVNVKQRRDYSFALFDARATRASARTFRCTWEPWGRRYVASCGLFRHSPGDSFITNDPYRGGSHLPDITVMTPVFDDVAKRGQDVCRQSGRITRTWAEYPRIDVYHATLGRGRCRDIPMKLSERRSGLLGASRASLRNDPHPPQIREPRRYRCSTGGESRRHRMLSSTLRRVVGTPGDVRRAPADGGGVRMRRFIRSNLRASIAASITSTTAH